MDYKVKKHVFTTINDFTSSRIGMTQASGLASNMDIHSSRVLVAIRVDNFDFKMSTSSPNCGNSSDKDVKTLMF